MKLSRASHYAVIALASMARPGDGLQLMASHVTADAGGIPPRFLLKILKLLARAGMLDSQKGPGGGYRLARPASKVTLLEIVETVDGPVGGNPFLGKRTGRFEARLREVCDRVTGQTRWLLGKVTLAESVGDGKDGRRRKNGNTHGRSPNER